MRERFAARCCSADPGALARSTRSSAERSGSSQRAHADSTLCAYGQPVPADSPSYMEKHIRGPTCADRSAHVPPHSVGRVKSDLVVVHGEVLVELFAQLDEDGRHPGGYLPAP